MNQLKKDFLKDAEKLLQKVNATVDWNINSLK